MKDFDYSLLKTLPSPFYRVSVKALIFDGQNRLLVGRGEQDPHGWEIPGGGWEHDESLEDCLKREVKEELGIELTHVSEPLFVYTGKSTRGWMIVRIAVPAKLAKGEMRLGEITEAKFVTKEEFLKLDFAADEGTVLGQVDKIWPA